MSVDPNSLAQYFNKFVLVNVNTGKDETGADTYETREGKVVTAGRAGIALRSRGNTIIIEAKDIIDIEETKRNRKPRIVRRVIRPFSRTDFIRQHLADRHGIPVSLLKEIDEETAHDMHEKTDHSDLGHYHGDRARAVAAAMQRLDEADEDEDE